MAETICEAKEKNFSNLIAILSGCLLAICLFRLVTASYFFFGEFLSVFIYLPFSFYIRDFWDSLFAEFNLKNFFVHDDCNGKSLNLLQSFAGKSFLKININSL
jgi:hypothetical protein